MSGVRDATKKSLTSTIMRELKFKLQQEADARSMTLSAFSDSIFESATRNTKLSARRRKLVHEETEAVRRFRSENKSYTVIRKG